MGWLFDKRCTLMKTFGWSWRFTGTGITAAQGWAFWSWAKFNEANFWGGMELTDGYVNQEIKRRIKNEHGRVKR